MIQILLIQNDTIENILKARSFNAINQIRYKLCIFTVAEVVKGNQCHSWFINKL